MRRGFFSAESSSSLDVLRRVRLLVVVFALVIAAGLVHAAFEDWMFAAGYYMSPLFWSFAFVCVDMIRDIEGHQPAVSQAVHSWAEMPPLVAQP